MYFQLRETKKINQFLVHFDRFAVIVIKTLLVIKRAQNIKTKRQVNGITRAVD